MSGVAEAFGTERPGGAWASYASSRIRATLENDEVLQHMAHNVECRQQTCRLEISDDGSVSARMPMIARGLGEDFPTASAERVDRGNGHAMIIYLSSAKPTAPSGSK
jgi:hypothetical protein